MVFFFSSSPCEIFSSLQYIRANKPLYDEKKKCNKLWNSWTQFSYIYPFIQEIWFICILCVDQLSYCYNSITGIYNGNKSLSILLLSFQTKKPIMATAWSVYDRRAVWESNQIGSGIKPKWPFKAAECDTAWHQEFDLILQLSYGWATFHLDWFDISAHLVWKAGWYKQGVMQTP